MRTFVYDDPTGGGDDIKLVGPDWLEIPPSWITILDTAGESHEFTLVEEEEGA